jgi:hypothetical protein
VSSFPLLTTASQARQRSTASDRRVAVSPIRRFVLLPDVFRIEAANLGDTADL